MGTQIYLWIFTISLSTLSTTILANIPLGSSLSPSNNDQSWSSPSKTYSLSFTTSSGDSSSSYTASILFSGGVPIWSTPSTVDSNGALHLDSSGLLRLVNGSGTTVWDSGTANLGVSAANLDDSGNLVLSNVTGTVWSSFQNPSDTIVPSQNFTVGKTLRNGDYSFYLQNSGNLTLRWNDSTVYYTKGLNSSVNVSLNAPSIGLQQNGVLNLFDSMLKSSVVMAYSSDYAEGGTSRLRFLRLDNDGNLRLYSSDPGSGTTTTTWAAMGDQCEVFGYCGNLGVCSYNDTSPICICPSENFELVDKKNSRKGCKRKIPLDNCPDNPTMLELDHTVFFTYDTIQTSNTQTFYSGMTGCRSNCLSSGASCTASTSLSDGSGLCYLKTPDFISGYQSPSLPSTSFVKICGTAEPNPPISEVVAGKGKGWKLHAWVIVVVVVVTLLGLVGLEYGLWWFFCRNSSKFGTFSAQYALLEYASGAPVQFSYKELQNATKGHKKFSLWAYEEFENGNAHAIIDKRLVGPGLDMEQVVRMILVSFWCIQEQPSQRPVMGKVVRMLEGITDIEKPPAPKILTEGSVGGTSIVSNVSAFSTLAPSAPAPSSSSSARTLGLSPLASGRNIERVSSSSLRTDTDRK
ncbi:hypothetical protein ACFE04_002281 [Oxalis oulophora]